MVFVGLTLHGVEVASGARLTSNSYPDLLGISIDNKSSDSIAGLVPEKRLQPGNSLFGENSNSIEFSNHLSREVGIGIAIHQTVCWQATVASVVFHIAIRTPTWMQNLDACDVFSIWQRLIRWAEWHWIDLRIYFRIDASETLQKWLTNETWRKIWEVTFYSCQKVWHNTKWKRRKL